MKPNYLLFSFLFLASTTVFAQSRDAQHLNERFTHGAENGYSWLEYAKTSHTVEDYRYNFLASMLDYHRGENKRDLSQNFQLIALMIFINLVRLVGEKK